jgi:DNA repair protein RadA/Sms
MHGKKGAWTFTPDKPAFIRLSEVVDTTVIRVLGGHWTAPYLGGGMVAGTTLLMAGDPGIGKSTVCLDLLDKCIEETGKDALYLRVEETEGVLRGRALRLGCKNVHRMLLPSEKLTPELDLLDNFPPVCMAVLDSVTKLAGHSDLLAVRIGERMTAYAQATGTPCILLSHATKDKDFAGLMTSQHDPDATVYLSGDRKSNIRTWTTDKNRNGPGKVSVKYTMTERGLQVIEAEEEDDAPAFDRGRFGQAVARERAQ